MSKIIRWGESPESISEDMRCPFPHWDHYKRRQILGPPGTCRLHHWANQRRYQKLKQWDNHK